MSEHGGQALLQCVDLEFFDGRDPITHAGFLAVRNDFTHPRKFPSGNLDRPHIQSVYGGGAEEGLQLSTQALAQEVDGRRQLCSIRRAAR